MVSLELRINGSEYSFARTTGAKSNRSPEWNRRKTRQNNEKNR